MWEMISEASCWWSLECKGEGGRGGEDGKEIKQMQLGLQITGSQVCGSFMTKRADDFLIDLDGGLTHWQPYPQAHYLAISERWDEHVWAVLDTKIQRLAAFFPSLS